MLVLRDYQNDCVAAHFDWFERNKEGNPLFVVPTGGGKSLILSEFIKITLKAWPETRLLVVTHVQELIEQNHAEFVKHWGGNFLSSPAGIYSAGVGRRDVNVRVLFAGIQSIFNKAELLGSFNLILVDECHLIPKKGMGRYRTYIEAQRKINPAIRVCGYTATHYRLDGGYLHKGDNCLFSAVAYTVPVELLIEKGYLVPLIAKKPERTINTAGIKKTGGDFNLKQLEASAIEGDNVEAAVEEMVRVGREQKRKSWLVFAIGIEHAGQVIEELRRYDVECDSIFGHTPKADRKRIVEAFKLGELPVLVNVGVLTTGFNAPRCDLMAVMRPTQSTALYVQIMGRGMRTFPGKKNCLVLDYGENVERHGPINRVRPKKEESGDGPAPLKTCPECAVIVSLGVKVCPLCGYEWKAQELERDHERMASYLSPVDMKANKPRILKVSGLFFRKHKSKRPDRPDSLRVDFLCGMRTFTEWVCLEHADYPKRKAVKWWSAYGGAVPAPETVDEALKRSNEIGRPHAIEVVAVGEFDRIKRPLWQPETA